MADQFNQTDLQIARLVEALFGVQPGNEFFTLFQNIEAQDGIAGLSELLVQHADNTETAESFAKMIVANLAISDQNIAEPAEAFVANALGADKSLWGANLIAVLDSYVALDDNDDFSEFVATFNNRVKNSLGYSLLEDNQGVRDVVDTVHTLIDVPGVEGEDGQLMWDGISAADFLDFLTNLAGLDVAQLGLIDQDGVSTIEQVSNITVGDTNVIDNQSLTEFTITFDTSDGHSITTDAQLASDYLDFLTGFIFDENGHSRLYYDYIPGEDGGAVVLTPNENNGGTFEGNHTTATSDLIVAGRTELLHGAYIDGGAGRNVLEVDLKGVYAQPLELLNIHQINVQNLPNVYTTYNDSLINEGEDGIDNIQGYQGGNSYGSSYPVVTGDGPTQSVLDISRAIDLEKLVVTEGFHNAGLGDASLGMMTVLGIRNDAVVRLEGGFHQDVYLHYGEGHDGAVDLELNLGDTDDFDLYVAHNANTLNLHSEGTENWLHDGYFGGKLSNLNISGDAPLYIEGDLNGSFHASRPATIDASANTGGVDLLIDGHTSDVVRIIGSTGNDVLKARGAESVDIQNALGDNRIEADGSEIVDIVTGTGSDFITATDSAQVTIDAGNGNNIIAATAAKINLTSGEGDDLAVVGGTAEVVMSNHPHDGSDTESAALITVDLGSGNNQLHLGTGQLPAEHDDYSNLPGVIAQTGSTITGENITVYVHKASNLSEAVLEGIDSVVLMGDGDGNEGELTITSDQFVQIGAANFSVANSAFGSKEYLNIIITEDTVLSDLGVADLPAGIYLNIELKNGAELTLSAEELHQHIANNGIDSTDGLRGKVVITNAGVKFNAFTGEQNPDTAEDDPTDWFNTGEVGTLSDSFADSDDVTILRSIDGFDRPEPDVSADTLTIVSTGGENNTVGDINAPAVHTLVLEGDENMTFTGTVTLLGGVIADPAEDGFTVDFGGHGAVVSNLRLAGFHNVKEVIGNDPIVDGEEVPTRIDVLLGVDDEPGSAKVGELGNENGLHSSGVETFVVVDIADMNDNGENDDTGMFYVCDKTEDLEVLGLQGNAGNTIHFMQVNFDTTFLLEGDGQADYSDLPKALGNPNVSGIGTFNADFFHAGATAVVDINNRGVDLGLTSDGLPRPLMVDAINISNARSVEINVENGNAVIGSINDAAADDHVEDLVFNSAFDVTVKGGFDLAELSSIDASAVDGVFTLELTDGSDNDFSGVAFAGVEQLIFNHEDGDGNATMATLTIDQLLGLTVISETDSSTLDFVDLADQAVDFTAIDVDELGSVVFAEVDGVIVVDPTTVFGNGVTTVDDLKILAETSDTTVELTEAQFNQVDGAAPVVMTELGTNAATGDDFVATIVITDLAEDAEIDLDNVAAEPVIRVADLTATEDMAITNGDAVLEVAGGDVDLTEADLEAITEVTFTADATLTLTAAQVAAIGTLDDDGDGVADAWSAADGVTVTLNVIDLFDEAIDLDAINAAGITIGSVSINDSTGTDGMDDVIIDADTTFGGAEIITPTADVNDDEPLADGLEPTELTLSVAQLQSSSGVISGDSVVHLTDLMNNEDSDGDFELDQANFDLSTIANAGTLTLGEDTVTLADVADLGDFEILLDHGQMIQFATEAQASGTTVTEIAGTTAIAWLWDTKVNQVDTTNYDENINTLFINEDLVDGQNEEDLWNTLPSTIVVEKVNVNDIPDVLIGFQRVNTFEALTALVGVTYDDQDEFETVQTLIMNVEGNTNLGNVVVDDTVGEGDFQLLTINSYEDRSTLVSDNGFGFQPNIIGDISLGALTTDDPIEVIIDTHVRDGDFGDGDGFMDAEIVGEPAAERDGLAIEIGVISFGDQPDFNMAKLTLEGEEDITIGGIDISEPGRTLLHVDNNNTGTVEIGGVNINDDGDAILDPVDNIFVIDGYVGDDDLGDALTADLLQVIGGDNDLTEADVDDINAFHVSGDATITMTAAQIIAIGEGNFSINTGATVVLHVTELGNDVIDLNVIQDAGFDIGNVSTVEDSGAGAVDTVLDDLTTLGGADSLNILLNDEDNSLTLSAEQYLQINAGNILETDSDATTDESANVTITDLDGIAEDKSDSDPQQVADIDLSTVLATGDLWLQLADAGTAADIEIHADADLGGFSLVLDSLGATLNDLAGQTVRFNTAVQAERMIDVTGDAGAADNATNVVWLFDAITGTVSGDKVDTAGYDVELGRVWMLEGLVKDANVEELFTSLSETIIIRVVNEDDLDALVFTQGLDRHIEIESFTDLTDGGTVSGDFTFSDVDDAAETVFDFVETLIFDVGGNVVTGDIAVDNVLAAAINNDDEFLGITINSMLADGTGNADYLLPELPAGTVFGNNAGEVPFPEEVNEIGDILSGDANDFDLGRVEVNTGVAGAGGNGLILGTVFFSDDGDELTGTAAPTVAEFEVNGDGDVTAKSLDVSNGNITGLSVMNLGAGALTITGGSPGFDGGDDSGETETLTVTSTDAASSVTYGSIDGATTYAGIYGFDLSLITLIGAGTIDLGTIAQVDSEDFTIDGALATGVVTMTLGQADANGVKSPELDAAGTWAVNMAAGADVTLTIDDTVVFNAGGELELTNVDTVSITGDVDLSEITLTLAGTTTFDVPAGSSLTLTAEQANGLTVTGAGTVEILNLEATPAADLSDIMTEIGDTGTVNAAVDTSDDDDVDTDPEDITLTGALGVAHVTISGDGSVTVDNTAFAGTAGLVDRNDPVTGGDTSDDDLPSFTVGASATLNLNAAQVGEATGAAASSWSMLVDGAGTVAVSNLAVNQDADLSGLTASTVTAVTDTVTFTGNLGTADVTINAGQTLTVDGAIVSGLNVGGEGTLEVSGTDIDSDLSNVTADFITFAAGATLDAVTFPVLREADAGANPPIVVQTVTLSSTQADGQTITGENGNDGGVVVVNIDDTVDGDTDGDVDAFDLSGISAGTLTAIIDDTADDTVVFDAAVDFGTFDIQITAGDTVTMTGNQADGLTITETGAATLNLVDVTGSPDLTNITVTTISSVISGGTVDLSTVVGLTAIDITDGDTDPATGADVTLSADQFGALEAGANTTAVDLPNMSSLLIDVERDISGTIFNVDLVINPDGLDTVLDPANLNIIGSAAGLVQARVDDDLDLVAANSFTTNILNAANSVTHTDLGSIVTADSGAVGVGGVEDFFQFNAVPTTNATAITTFSGTGGDGDKVDLSNIGDSDNTVFDLSAGTITTTVNDNDVLFADGGAAGDADSEAAAATYLTTLFGGGALTETGTNAFYVVADDNSSAVYEYNQVAADGAIAADELTLIGTIDSVLQVTDVVA